MNKAVFLVQAIGPQGGSRTKSGIQAVRAFLMHQEARTSLMIEGFLLDGVPYVRIVASSSTNRQTLFEGPLDDLPSPIG